MTQETKLGIFVLAGVVGLVISVLLLGDFQFQSRYNINILFDDIAGLPDKAKVKISGVEVGAVKSVSLESNKARVKIWVKSDVRVHRGAQANIVATGLIGSKFLELTVGDPQEPFLEDGATINGTSPVSLDKAVSQVMSKIDSLISSFQGGEGANIGQNLAMTLKNLRDVSDTLRSALINQDQKIAAIINNVNSFTGDIAEITSDNKENVRIAVTQIKDASAKLDSILAKLQSGEGTVGKLVSDKEMGEDIKETFKDVRETVSQAKQAVRRLNLIETSWDYTLRFDTKYDVYHHDLGLRISPRPGKFYYLGGSNVGDLTPNDPEEANTFNFLIGRDFGPFEVYAGAIRSKGGFGGKVKPFWKWDPLSRFEITAQAYNFFRDVPVRRPKVNAGVAVQVWQNSSVGVQMEDIYYASSPNIYANLVFRDDDIAYIIGLIGLSKF